MCNSELMNGSMNMACVDLNYERLRPNSMPPQGLLRPLSHLSFPLSGLHLNVGQVLPPSPFSLHEISTTQIDPLACMCLLSVEQIRRNWLCRWFWWPRLGWSQGPNWVWPIFWLFCWHSVSDIIAINACRSPSSVVQRASQATNEHVCCNQPNPSNDPRRLGKWLHGSPCPSSV